MRFYSKFTNLQYGAKRRKDGQIGNQIHASANGAFTCFRIAGSGFPGLSRVIERVSIRPCTANHNIFHCYPSFHLVVTRMLFLQKKKRSHPHKNIVRDESAELTCYHPVSLASHDSKPYQVRIGNDLSKLYRGNGRTRRSLTRGLGAQLKDHVQPGLLHPLTARQGRRDSLKSVPGLLFLIIAVNP